MLRSRHFSLVPILACVLASASSARAAGAPLPVLEVGRYGAKGDGIALDTPAIQAAIDAASQAGGGAVHFSAGTYRTGPIVLKSHVHLDLDRGAVIQASLQQIDWPGIVAVISARNVADVAVTGQGIIDGGATAYYDAKGEFLPGNRPQSIIAIEHATDVLYSGVTLRNSVRWTCVSNNVDRLTIQGLVIRNNEYALGRETDGIDLNCSRYVLVEDCDIETGDDGICLKPQQTRYAPAMHDIRVVNCRIATTCNATKIGTGTANELYNVVFDHIRVDRHADVRVAHNPIRTDAFGSRGGDCIAAISVQSNDGGYDHDIQFSHYEISACDTPIFIEVQNRTSLYGEHPPGRIARISFSDIHCAFSARASQINDQEGAVPDEAISFHHLDIHNFETYAGKASPPRLTGIYPDGYKSGRMPAFGLFARDVAGLSLDGTNVFHDDGHSGRPATVYEHVTAAP